MDLPEDVIKAWQKKITSLTLEELDVLWFVSPKDWEVFCNYGLWSFFVARWMKLGGKERALRRGKDFTLISSMVKSGRLFYLLERPPVH